MEARVTYLRQYCVWGSPEPGPSEEESHSEGGKPSEGDPFGRWETTVRGTAFGRWETGVGQRGRVSHIIFIKECMERMSTQIEKNAISAIRVLSADMIQKANSGHPGLPLGAASVA